MNEDKYDSDNFSYDYQQIFILYYVKVMSDGKLKKLARHYDGKTRIELAESVLEYVCFNDQTFSLFFKRFPLSQQDCVEITKRMLHNSCISLRSDTKIKRNDFVKAKAKK